MDFKMIEKENLEQESCLCHTPSCTRINGKWVSHEELEHIKTMAEDPEYDEWAAAIEDAKGYVDLFDNPKMPE